jgi:exopolyphosphatase / guanosine-5'-triphosphate,3'-diphosphate pyrophosphatase
MRVASIDIGTNTTLLLVAEQNADGTVSALAERAEITRLGRGIGGDGLLRDDNVNRTLEVLASYAEHARLLAAPIVAIGTEGLRRAPNAGVFLEKAKAILGTAVEVISGDREAQLTFLAAQRSFPAEAAGNVVVIDIGGGSTEIIAAQGGRISFRQSLPLGSVRLTEAFVRNDPPTQAEIDQLENHVVGLLKDLPFSANATLIGAAGTVTTIAAMAQGLRDYDPAKVHGYQLTVAQLEAQVQRLRTSKQADREHMAGLDPRRADVIFAGSTLLKKIAERAGSPHVLVSDRGIRWGRLFDELDRASQPAVARGQGQG